MNRRRQIPARDKRDRGFESFFLHRGVSCFHGVNPGYFEDYVRHGFSMGRLGTAEEVVDVIVFIASPRAHWINGRNIPVDGLEQPHAPLDRRPH